MMARRWQLVVVVGVLAIGAQVATGKGKPGGGNPPPTPPGTIYFQVDGSGIWSMDAAGGNRTFLFAEGPGKEGAVPSHLVHAGHRWFVLGRQTADLLSDGSPRRELVARSDAGTEVLLWSAAGADVRPEKAWAHDDSIVSFKIAEPSIADSDILRADVDWSTGVPSLGTPTVLVDGVMGTFPASGNLIPVFEGFDLSPDGGRVVYAARNFVAGGIDLFVLDLASGTTLALGSGRRPAWSEDGSRIAFQGVTTGIFTIRPDGSDRTGIRSTGEQPVWSPDGDRVGLTATIQTGRGAKAATADEVVIVPSQGGADSNLTTNVDADARALGWR